MKFRKFYTDFATAYGTCWFILMLLALITQRHINAGVFGFWGFFIGSLVYAIVRAFIRKKRETMDF